MLYTGESQHLAVELFRGRIRVSYDVGNYPVSTMFSYELVADGKYAVIFLLNLCIFKLFKLLNKVPQDRVAGGDEELHTES